MKRELLQQLLADQETNRPVAVLTRVSDGAQALVYDDGPSEAAGFSVEQLGAARAALAADRSRMLDQELFVQIYNPPRRLLIVGAVHIAQALVPMAQLLGYAVTLVDPRRAWASESRFPGLKLRYDWPDAALQALNPDRRTAVVTLSHDPKLDDPALTVALRSPAFYVGALGSRRTHANRVQRLTEAGFTEAELTRIHAPIGLAIGAVSPAEIGLSILAEITQALHGQ